MSERVNEWTGHAVDLDEAKEMILDYEIGHKLAEGLEIRHAGRLMGILIPYVPEGTVYLVKEDWEDTFRLMVSLPCRMTSIHAKAWVRDLKALIETVE
jgi:hypothetical protein